MKIISTCPCCSGPMLHHFRSHGEYWFCRKCWQEMPNLSDIQEQNNVYRDRVFNLSTKSVEYKQAVGV